MNESPENAHLTQHAKEVKEWWELPRNLRWDKFYTRNDITSFRLEARQTMTLKYLDGLGLSRGARILELGYGAGQTASKVLERGYQYVGIDISQQLCDAAVRRCQDYVAKGMAHFRVGSIEESYPFSDQSFDVVMVIGALQYLGHQGTCAKEAHRVLKKNGHFIVCQTNMYSLKEMLSPRGLILRILYALLKEEYEIFPYSFKSMLVNTKLGRTFRRYEHARWMNHPLMLKGHEEKIFNINKRLNSYWRLKKILQLEEFEVLKADGAPFIWPDDKGTRHYMWRINAVCQKVADNHLFPFLFAFADNVILLTRKA